MRRPEGSLGPHVRAAEAEAAGLAGERAAAHDVVASVKTSDPRDIRDRGASGPVMQERHGSQRVGYENMDRVSPLLSGGTWTGGSSLFCRLSIA